MAKEVNIRIKINDNFKDVTVDASSLGKAIDQVTDSSKELSSTFVKFAAVSQIAENAASAIGQLNEVFSGLTAAYSAQSTAETRLAQAMSNTMAASAEEIQSIKDLCSSQQKLGVIGDEVQLAAAQELATYLEYSDSLKAIIPVMNDMAAQQYGLGASTESVTQIATMLGKVMNGQTEALSRYGYKFDEAQKQILQYGTEAERAAVLVDVVSQSVGGMNEALAKTPAGRMQQISNTFGDWKERLGEIAQHTMPVVTGFNALAKTYTTIVKLRAALKSMSLETIKAKVNALGLAAAHTTQSLAAKALGISETAAATATGVLRAKIIALQATMTMGLSIAITAVIDLVMKLANRSREAADAMEEADEASDTFAETSKNARSEIALYQVQLEDIIKHHKNDADAVKELNLKYGESFGYYKTAEDWYKVLTEKSAAYCRQLGYEAQARVIAGKKAAAEMKLQEIRAQGAEMIKNGTAQKKHFGVVHDADGNAAGWGTEYRDTPVFSDLRKQEEDLVAETEQFQSQFDTCTNAMLSAQEELRNGFEGPILAAEWEKMNLSQLTKAIQDQKGKVEGLAGSNEDLARKENATLKKMEARKAAIEKAYGLGSKSSGGKDDKFDGKKLIQNAESYAELGNNIKYYQEKLKETSPDQIEAIANLQEEINKLEEKQRLLVQIQELMAGDMPTDDLDAEIQKQNDQFENALKAGLEQEKKALNESLKDEKTLKDKFLKDRFQKNLNAGILAADLGLKADLVIDLQTRTEGVEKAKEKIESLKQLLAVAQGEERASIEAAIVKWRQYIDTQEDVSSRGEKITGAMGNVASMMDSLSGVVDDDTSGWLSWSANVLSSIAQVLPELARLVEGHIAEAFAGAAAQSQDVHFPFNIISLAASMAAVGAAVAKIPAFAEGGLALKPTIGLFGEAGPEAIIPLDRLPSLLGEGVGGVGGKVEFKIAGRDLLGVLNREQTVRARG